MVENKREVENILILGNGFDLAMGRKTSYTDFLEFLKLIKFFVEYKFKADDFLNEQIDKKHDFQSISKSKKSEIKAKDLNSDWEFIMSLSISVLGNEFEIYEQYEYLEKDKAKIKKITETRKKYIDLVLEKQISDSKSPKHNYLEDRILYEKFLKIFSDTEILNSMLDSRCDHFLNQGKYKSWSFFEGLKDNLIYDFIYSEKENLGGNWCNLELIISDLAYALSDIKQHIKDYEKYFNSNAPELAQAIEVLKAYENRRGIDMSSIISTLKCSISTSDFYHKKNPMAYTYIIENINKAYHDEELLKSAIGKLHDKLIKDLKDLTDWLEFYLYYLDIVDFKKLELYKELDLDTILKILGTDAPDILLENISAPQLEGISYIDELFYESGYLSSVFSDFHQDKISELFSPQEFVQWFRSIFSNVFFDIPNFTTSRVINFNYTDTITKYGINENNIHFIHGRLNLNRSRFPINQMVFGIEDKESEVEDISTDLIPYQKFYQRVVKETGNDYEDFFKTDNDKLILVFGHSVDPLDKEIFRNCFDLAEKGGYKYRFIFSYYNEKDKRSIAKNLAIILGKNRFITLSGQGRIKFVGTTDREKMKEILNEKMV